MTRQKGKQTVVETVHTNDVVANTYLQTLQALAAEMNAAMSAIAGNALSDLEDSVARQEMLCADLLTMKRTLPRDLRSSAHRELLPQLASINSLNMQYASLLKHSGRSIALLSALCQSHTGRSQEARGPRSKHQTWSCEM